jgi:hypothetical protein
MLNNPINPFEYVSILISIILGLGMTQLLASFSDLLYNFKKIKFYWPHTLWIVFVLFLHVQDWFITYKLKDRWTWDLPELFFVLLYPITLFMVAKLLLPTSDSEEKQNMKLFYKSQYPILFFVVSICVLISILFNLYFLNETVLHQIPLIILFLTVLFLSLRKTNSEIIHNSLAITLICFSIITTIIEKNIWVIK